MQLLMNDHKETRRHIPHLDGMDYEGGGAVCCGGGYSARPLYS